MADALLLCPEAPYPVVGGGPLRTACLLEYLAARYQLDVIVFREPGAPDPRPSFPSGLLRDVHVVDLPFHSKRGVARVLRNAERLLRGVPPLVDRFAGFPLYLKRDYDLAVVEHFWCAPYVDELRDRCRRVVLDLHNIESMLLQRCADTEGFTGRAALRRFAQGCQRMESKLLPKFDLLLVTSESDRRVIGEGFVWPNTIPLTPLPVVAKQDAVVFSGNMAYHPNIAAARYFARDVWPRLQGVDWWLVGKNPEALRLDMDLRIKVIGPVKDAVEAIAPARVAVVPLLSGSGTRFKILEAWAAGVPVVSTTIGAEGLDATPGVHLLIADSAAEFAASVTRVLNDQRLADHLARDGRALYEQNFTWPVAWKVLTAAGL